jgi:hypothetical protein
MELIWCSHQNNQGFAPHDLHVVCTKTGLGPSWGLSFAYFLYHLTVCLYAISQLSNLDYKPSVGSISLHECICPYCKDQKFTLQLV